MGGRFYVDTSAWLAILLRQGDWEEIAAELEGGQLLSSVLLVIEAERNLIRHARSGEIRPIDLQDALDRLREDVDLFQLRDLTLDLCVAGAMPPVSTPRTLDLVHLRTALWFHRAAPLDRFVSLDAAQVLAARELGLPT